MQIYTKASLIEKLKDIKNMGWVPNARIGNSGGIGNTLEDLLGIQENNLPIPNASVAEKHKEWLASVISKTGGAELDPQPYWGFNDLYPYMDPTSSCKQ